MRLGVRVRAIIAIAFVGVLSGSASASHVFTTDIKINGTAVAAGNSFVDPTISITAGDSVLFDIGAYGVADTLNVTFAANGSSTLPPPADFTTFFAGGGTASSPVRITFSRTFLTAGTFSGTLQPDFPSSSPDYQFPGGNQSDRPFIPFSINVSAAPSGAVAPLPTAAWGGMALLGGLGLIHRLRRTSAPAM